MHILVDRTGFPNLVTASDPKLGFRANVPALDMLVVLRDLELSDVSALPAPTARGGAQVLKVPFAGTESGSDGVPLKGYP